MNQVKEHLRLLSIFHYVLGGIGFLISLFPVIHLVIGLSLLLMPRPEPPRITASSFDPQVESVEIEREPETATAAPPAPTLVHNEEMAEKTIGVVFVVMASAFILVGFTLSALIIRAGRCLASHRSHTFCLVMAGFACVFVPLGTILGVFTIIILVKPEARELFGLPPLDESHPDEQISPGS